MAGGRPVFAAANRIRASSPEALERVVEAFRGRARRIEGQPGFLGLLVLADRGKGEVLVLSLWESREAFRAWVESDAFREAHERARARRLEGVESEGYEYEVVEASGPLFGGVGEKG